MNCQLTCGDAFTWICFMENESVDLVVTDPPYESLEKHREKGTTTRLMKNWFQVMRNEQFPYLFRELYRVLKRNTHCYVMCDAETMFIAKEAGEQAGFHFWKPLVWDKLSIGMGYHYRSCHEFILFFEKGKRRLNNLGTPDVLRHKRVRNGYPTEKPVDLCKILIEQSSAPGEIVLDPFMGSGTTGEAALIAGRRFSGCDISPQAVDMATKRLTELGQQTQGAEDA